MGGVRIRGGVGIRQSGSDFNKGMHNLRRGQYVAGAREGVLCGGGLVNFCV